MIHNDKTLMYPTPPKTVYSSPVLFQYLYKFCIVYCQMLPGRNCRIGKRMKKGKPE